MSMYLDVGKGGVEPAAQELYSSIRSIPETHVAVEEYIKKIQNLFENENPSTEQLSFPQRKLPHLISHMSGLQGIFPWCLRTNYVAAM